MAKGKKSKLFASFRSAPPRGEQPPAFVPQRIVMPAPGPEPHLDLVPSVLHGQYRIRAIWSRVYPRPKRETFHEFLVNITKWTMGREWWAHQVATPKADRHAVVRWAYAMGEFTRANLESADREEVDGETVYSGEQTGPVAALLQFGYDLFCLQARNKLPAFFVEKLRRRADFQGARYEIASAAIMMRAGFDIEYLDEQASNAKHCEFIATHRRTQAKVGVEAKSRKRPGMLNEPGEFDYEEDWRGIQNLIRKAKNQRPEGLPFFIFVDVNLPPSPDVAWSDKSWIRDVRRVLDALGTTNAENPDPFTALFPTNYAQYYGSNTEAAAPPEWGAVIPNHPIVRLPDRAILNDVTDTLARYGRIPREV